MTTKVYDAVWGCKIGEADRAAPPPGADGPMRAAVSDAFKALTGHAPHFIFSGWGAELTEPEKAVVENREPSRPAAPSGLTRYSIDERDVAEERISKLAALPVDLLLAILSEILTVDDANWSQRSRWHFLSRADLEAARQQLEALKG